jgi:integrase
MLTRRLAFQDYDGRTAVPHGLRSTFRDWCAENGKDDDAAEAALSHAIGGKVKRAYRRTDLLTARAALMRAWADYVAR